MTTDDLYLRARAAWLDAPSGITQSIRAVVDLALAERPEPTDWETLRAAAVIYRNHAPGLPGQRDADRLREVADRLEAAAQAEAAANTAQEALIEKAAETLRGNWEVLVTENPNAAFASMALARTLYAAGLLVDPGAEVVRDE